MATEKMYDLAFAYKNTKLWDALYDCELFALRFSDGQIGYCSVMGNLGEHIALALYVGAEGFASYRAVAFRDPEEDGPDIRWALNQDFLQCSLENKDELNEEEVREVRAYMKAHNIRVNGPHAWPKFLKYTRYRVPWPVQDASDVQRLCEALSAAIALAGFLETRAKSDLGVSPVMDDTRTLPLLIAKESGYVVSRTEVPGEWQETFPEPGPLDLDVVAQLRKLRKRGVYACELLRLPGLVQGQFTGREAPWFPVMFLCTDPRKRNMMLTDAITDYDTNPDAARDAFVRMLLQNGECPRAVKARDERTLVVLEDLCMKTNVLMSVDDNLPALDAVRENVLRMIRPAGNEMYMDDEDEDEEEDEDEDMDETIFNAMDELMKLSDKELQALPIETVRQILDMAYFGFVPQELQLRLRRLFKT